MEEKYKSMCFECGRREYPKADGKKLTGITVIYDRCPICSRWRGVVPARDWASACGKKGTMWD